MLVLLKVTLCGKGKEVKKKKKMKTKGVVSSSSNHLSAGFDASPMPSSNGYAPKPTT